MNSLTITDQAVASTPRQGSSRAWSSYQSSTGPCRALGEEGSIAAIVGEPVRLRRDGPLAT
jgi:hypothetical protein